MQEGATQRLYKYVGLVLLVLQQTSMPLMTRLVRYREHNQVFSTTVNVLLMEVIKLIVCCVVIAIQHRSILKLLVQCKRTIWDEPVETGKVCVPALIYTLQNNLYYIALSHLEATTFCLVYQMKVFTTAVFLRVLLHRHLSVQQWAALLLLAVGVADIQLQYQPPAQQHNIQQRPVLGFIAVTAMCFTSAFAGVYLEKVLKSQTNVSIWMQNVRLSLLGLPISAISVLLYDRDLLLKGQLLQGFDSLVWVMTLTNSLGGLLISIVIKYADNILKAYAQSAAILGAALGSWLLFDFVPNPLFMLGAGSVMVSVCVYTAYPHK